MNDETKKRVEIQKEIARKINEARLREQIEQDIQQNRIKHGKVVSEANQARSELLGDPDKGGAGGLLAELEKSGMQAYMQWVTGMANILNAAAKMAQMIGKDEEAKLILKQIESKQQDMAQVAGKAGDQLNSAQHLSLQLTNKDGKAIPVKLHHPKTLEFPPGVHNDFTSAFSTWFNAKGHAFEIKAQGDHYVFIDKASKQAITRPDDIARYQAVLDQEVQDHGGDFIEQVNRDYGKYASSGVSLKFSQNMPTVSPKPKPAEPEAKPEDEVPSSPSP
jgi:hypothetical protein